MREQVLDKRSERWPLQLSLLAGSVLVVICSTPLAPALPKMREAFVGAGDLQVPMVLTIPALVIVLWRRWSAGWRTATGASPCSSRPPCYTV